MLSQLCMPVPGFANISMIVQDLHDTLSSVQNHYDFKRGSSGISAPQIGYPVRISLVECDGIRSVLINPHITEHSETKSKIREGCLSFFGVRGDVARYDSVTVSATNERGEAITIRARGAFAMLLQHEIDHLNGKLYVDHLLGGDRDLYPADGVPDILK